MIETTDWLIVIIVFCLGALIPLVWFRLSINYVYYLMRVTPKPQYHLQQIEDRIEQMRIYRLSQEMFNR